MQIDLNGFVMGYEEAGESGAPPVLLVHGYPLNRRMWGPQMEALGEVARVLAPDLPGHGDSDGQKNLQGIAALADALRIFLDALGETRPVVVCGLSMGGYISMAFCRQYPKRVAGLVLAATRAGIDSPEAREARDQSAKTAEEQGVEAAVGGMLPKMLSPKTYDEKPALVDFVREMMVGTSLEGVVTDLHAMRERADSMDTLRGFGAPLLILHGADDQLIPVSEAEAMQAAARNGRLEVLPEAGHLLNLEQPEMFNAHVRQYLQELRASGWEALGEEPTKQFP